MVQRLQVVVVFGEFFEFYRYLPKYLVFCIFSNKTHLTWKIRIKSCDTSIELVYYKLFPRKYLYVNGLLRETVTKYAKISLFICKFLIISSVFGRFRYFFYVQGHHIQLEYENSSYSLYINKKPLSYYIENYNSKVFL